jgi:O-antigen ligase
MRPAPVRSRNAEPAEVAGSISFLFFFFAAVLIYGVAFMGMPVSQALMVDRRHRDIFMLTVGAFGIAGAFTAQRAGSRSREERLILSAAMGLPCYALLQIVPLPVTMLGVLSPVRAELVRALTPVTGPHSFASFSIVPAATFTHFLLLTAYCVIFFSVWSFASRAREKAWLIASPVVFVAAIEAILGLIQMVSGVKVSGTYSVRNHFSGLLEMALPFPLMYAISALREALPRGYAEASSVSRIAAGTALAVLLVAGSLFSLSRGGLASILVSSLVMAAVATNWKMSLGRKLATAIVFCLFAAVALFFLTPISLVTRLAQHNTAGRLSVWSEGIAIVGQYPLFGCGLGGFESAFLKFKVVEGLILVDYAHNDYLQLMSELGIAGFLIGATLFGSVARRVLRIADDTSEIRWLGLACVGSLAAIAVHSAVDFNLYVPANAAVLAWICGMAAGLKASGGPRHRALAEVEPVTARAAALPHQATPFQ